MPTVPRYSQQQDIGRRVGDRPVPGVKLNPVAPEGAFGGGSSATNVSNATIGTLSVIEKYQAEQRKQADELAVLDADKNLSALETRLQYDPKTGAMTKRGKDALALPDQIKTDWDKGVEDISKNLNSDTQRLAFRKMVNARWSSLDSSVQKHVASEIRSYDDATTESYLANERDAAALNFMDPERIQMSLYTQRAALVKHAERNGLPEEWLKLKINDAQSKTHSAVIERMLTNNQDMAAKQYFEANKDQISGRDSTTLEKALEEGSLRGESQRRADEIFLNSKDNHLKALELTRSINDPKLRDETETRVNRMFSAQKTAEAEFRNDLYLKAANIIDGNRGSRNVRDLVPPSMWTQLTPEQRNALENRASDPQNNDKAWLDFLDLKAPDMAKLSRAEFETKYWAQLDKAHRTRAEGMWNDAREASSKSMMDPKLSTTVTFNDRVKNTLLSNDLIKPDYRKSEDASKLYSQFEQAAAHEVENFELTQLGGKRKATGDEIQKIIDGLIIKKVFVDRTFLPDAEKPVVILTADEKGVSYVPVEKIPGSDKNAIENLIRSKNKKITIDKIQKAYAAYLIGDKQLFDSVVAQ